jgi:hypothetical protein
MLKKDTARRDRKNQLNIQYPTLSIQQNKWKIPLYIHAGTLIMADYYVDFIW